MAKQKQLTVRELIYQLLEFDMGTLVDLDLEGDLGPEDGLRIKEVKALGAYCVITVEGY